MKPVIELIERTAPSDANVLITGENGTGKGLVAQAIHALSPRAPRPMVTVNAGGVSETVFESELFGHVRGAFTDARADRVGRFELADGGTLFLDEIANVPLVAAGQAAARARDRRVRAARLVAHAPRRRAHPVGDQRRHRRRSGRRALPPGSAVPAQHHRDRAAAAARSARRHSVARHALPRAARAALPQAPDGLRQPPQWTRCCATRGRETSASSSTRSSGRC